MCSWKIKPRPERKDVRRVCRGEEGRGGPRGEGRCPPRSWGLEITPKHSGLKQHLWSHSFCGSGVSTWLCWGLWVGVSHKALIKAEPGSEVPMASMGGTGSAPTPSSPMWSLEDSALPGPLPRTCHQFLACGSLSGQVPKAAVFITGSQSAKLQRTRMEVLWLMALSPSHSVHKKQGST